MTKMLTHNQVHSKMEKDTIPMKQILKKDQKLPFNKTGKIFKLLMSITDLTKSLKRPKKVKIFMSLSL